MIYDEDPLRRACAALPALQVLDRSSFTPAFLGDDSSHVGLAEHGIVDVSGY